MTFEKRETRDLIGGDKVEGTAVTAGNQRIGSIERASSTRSAARSLTPYSYFGGFPGTGTTPTRFPGNP